MRETALWPTRGRALLSRGCETLRSRRSLRRHARATHSEPPFPVALPNSIRAGTPMNSNPAVHATARGESTRRAQRRRSGREDRGHRCGNRPGEASLAQAARQRLAEHRRPRLEAVGRCKMDRSGLVCAAHVPSLVRRLRAGMSSTSAPKPRSTARCAVYERRRPPALVRRLRRPAEGRQFGRKIERSVLGGRRPARTSSTFGA